MASEIAASFYCGNYQNVIDATIDSPDYRVNLDELHFVIGALSYVGRLEDADHLSSARYFSQLSKDQQSEIYYYRAVGMCRHSCYVEAGRMFFENLKRGRRGSPRERFFAFQGLGFYAYFRSRFRQAARFARLAADEAMIVGFTYGRAHAEDLRGHSLVQLGSLREGLNSLKLARKLANRLGSGGFEKAIRITHTLYQAHHGLLEDPIAEIERILALGHHHNNYSQSIMYLELAHQQLLRGSRIQAEKTLDEVTGLVFESRNRRHGAILNLRLAQVARSKGSLAQALNLVRSAISEINTDVDRALHLQLLGMELELCRLMNISPRQENIELTERLRHRVARRINQRIMIRHTPEALDDEPSNRQGEDPMGDLMDVAAKGGFNAVNSIVESGYLGLLPRTLQLPVSGQLICLDPIPGSLLVIDQGEVRILRSNYSSAIRAFLSFLAKGPVIKEQIVKELWGYRYNPLRHDSLVYRLVSRTRLALGEYSNWLHCSESHYGLVRGIEVVDVSTNSPNVTELIESADRKPLETGPSLTEEAVDLRLNVRQLQLLDRGHARMSTIIDPKWYRREFEVSAATARRDLGELVEKGYLSRLGQGRSTKYIRCSPQQQLGELS